MLVDRVSRVAIMKWFRFSISSLMAVVLVVALDCMAINMLIVRLLLRPNLSELIVFGALPMANILAVGLLRLWADRKGRGQTRPFLVGFEVCGWVTLFVFVTCAVLATDSLHDGVGYLLRSAKLTPGDRFFLICAVAILLVPQFALASVGGWLIRSYTDQDQDRRPAERRRAAAARTRRGTHTHNELASSSCGTELRTRTRSSTHGHDVR